jgi:CTP:molybdopterin cytidylyltransferase MocA
MRQVAGLSGDQGARELLRGGRRIECGHLAGGADVDRPADLELIRARLT